MTSSFDPFWIFFDKLVPNVAGRKVWSNKIKVSRTITESGCVTITDEAFTILAIENYWERWMDPRKSAKWTDSRRGNQQFMGWSDEAYTRYDNACKLIKTQRATPVSKQLENQFKTRARNLYANGRVLSRCDARKEPQVEIFDELEIE